MEACECREDPVHQHTRGGCRCSVDRRETSGFLHGFDEAPNVAPDDLIPRQWLPTNLRSIVAAVNLDGALPVEHDDAATSAAEREYVVLAAARMLTSDDEVGMPAGQQDGQPPRGRLDHSPFDHPSNARAPARHNPLKRVLTLPLDDSLALGFLDLALKCQHLFRSRAVSEQVRVWVIFNGFEAVVVELPPGRLLEDPDLRAAGMIPANPALRLKFLHGGSPHRLRLGGRHSEPIHQPRVQRCVRHERAGLLVPACVAAQVVVDRLHVVADPMGHGPMVVRSRSPRGRAQRLRDTC